MPASRTKILVAVACAFIATALAFLSASVASFLVTSDIEKQTSGLLTNALPSVRELTQARTALRELNASLNQAALAPPPRDEHVLEAHWKDLDSALTQETATPWYVGEHELYERQVKPAITELGFAIDDFEHLAAAPADDPAFARATARLRDATDRADKALVGLSDLNHDQAFLAAEQIVRNRREAARASLYLDIGATIVAAIAALLAIRFTRHFAHVMRRNVELETDRANQLDLFAQRVAHDLMSPLAAVSLTLDSVQRQHGDEDMAGKLERARQVLRRSRRMVDGIYAFSKSLRAPCVDAVSHLRSAVIDAARALQTVESVEGRNCPTIEVEDFDDVEVSIERGMLDVVLTNLLSNASKFTADAAVRRVTVRACMGDQRVRVEVEDTGPGVPDGVRETIFEPYKRASRTGKEGLGLGLATVKRVVLACDGAVGVRNAPTGGAVFWFELPVTARPVVAAAPRGPTGERVPLAPSAVDGERPHVPYPSKTVTAK